MCRRTVFVCHACVQQQRAVTLKSAAPPLKMSRYQAVIVNALTSLPKPGRDTRACTQDNVWIPMCGRTFAGDNSKLLHEVLVDEWTGAPHMVLMIGSPCPPHPPPPSPSIESSLWSVLSCLDQWSVWQVYAKFFHSVIAWESHGTESNNKQWTSPKNIYLLLFPLLIWFSIVYTVTSL